MPLCQNIVFDYWSFPILESVHLPPIKRGTEVPLEIASLYRATTRPVMPCNTETSRIPSYLPASALPDLNSSGPNRIYQTAPEPATSQLPYRSAASHSTPSHVCRSATYPTQPQATGPYPSPPDLNSSHHTKTRLPCLTLTYLTDHAWIYPTISYSTLSRLARTYRHQPSAATKGS